MMKKIRRIFVILLSMLILACGISACGEIAEQLEPEISKAAEEFSSAAEEASADLESEALEASEDRSSEETEESDLSEEETDSDTETEAETESETETEPETEAETEDTEELLDPDGSYYSADEVALYIHQYGELPGNFITKKEAESLGWSGGAVEPYAAGKVIGGSHFGNYEEILPDGNYTECDIDTLGKARGAKRLVFSDDGDIYYTEDHYETFRLLYTADGKVEEEIIYGGD